MSSGTNPFQPAALRLPIAAYFSIVTSYVQLLVALFTRHLQGQSLWIEPRFWLPAIDSLKGGFLSDGQTLQFFGDEGCQWSWQLLPTHDHDVLNWKKHEKNPIKRWHPGCAIPFTLSKVSCVTNRCNMMQYQWYWLHIHIEYWAKNVRVTLHSQRNRTTTG